MSRMTRQAKIEHETAMRQAIRTAFAELFRTRGSVSMSELAESLHIAKGTLYLYYRAKDELVADVMTIRRDAMFARMDQELSDKPDADARLVGWVRIMCEDFEHYRCLRMEFLKSNPLPSPHYPHRGLERLETILSEGVRTGVYRADLDIPEAAIFLFCALIGKFRFCLKNNLRIEPEQETEHFLSFARPGLVITEPTQSHSKK